MTLDPIDPGAMPLATVPLTTNQARKLAEVVDEHLSEHQLDSVRLEQLKDAHVRVVLIGPDGDPVAEQLLLPV